MDFYSFAPGWHPAAATSVITGQNQLLTDEPFDPTISPKRRQLLSDLTLPDETRCPSLFKFLREQALSSGDCKIIFEWLMRQPLSPYQLIPRIAGMQALDKTDEKFVPPFDLTPPPLYRDDWLGRVGELLLTAWQQNVVFDAAVYADTPVALLKTLGTAMSKGSHLRQFNIADTPRDAEGARLLANGLKNCRSTGFFLRCSTTALPLVPAVPAATIRLELWGEVSLEQEQILVGLLQNRTADSKLETVAHQGLQPVSSLRVGNAVLAANEISKLRDGVPDYYVHELVLNAPDGADGPQTANDLRVVGKLIQSDTLGKLTIPKAWLNRVSPAQAASWGSACSIDSLGLAGKDDGAPDVESTGALKTALRERRLALASAWRLVDGIVAAQEGFNPRPAAVAADLTVRLERASVSRKELDELKDTLLDGLVADLEAQFGDHLTGEGLPIEPDWDSKLIDSVVDAVSIQDVAGELGKRLDKTKVSRAMLDVLKQALRDRIGEDIEAVFGAVAEDDATVATDQGEPGPGNTAGSPPPTVELLAEQQQSGDCKTPSTLGKHRISDDPSAHERRTKPFNDG